MPLKNINKQEYIILRKKGYSKDDLIKMDSLVRPEQLQELINSRSKVLMNLDDLNPEPQKNFIGKATDFLFGNTKKFGKTIGGALATVTEGKNIDESARRNIESGDKLMELAERTTDPQHKQRLIKLAQEAYDAAGVSYKDIIPETKKTTKQILGEALGTSTEVLTSLGGLKVGGELAKPATEAATGLIKGVKKGAAVGALSGGAFGLSGGLQSKRKDENLFADTMGGAITGGALGGILGGATGFISKKIAKKAAIKKLIETEPNATVVKYKLKGSKLLGLPKVVKDKNAITLLKNGIDDTELAVIKGADKPDKEVFYKMFNVAKKASKDRKVLDRPSDIVGENIINQVKFLKNRLNKTGQKLDKVVGNLKGKKIFFDDVINHVDDSLAKHGITKTKQGLNFVGSDFEGLNTQNKLLDNIYNRIRKAKDAHDLHRLKKFIDTNVDFGKSKEGLTGQAERLVKGWRNAIDKTLDNTFESYNRYNSEYSQIINALNEYRHFFDKELNLDELGKQRAGQVARRIFGNSANRANILRSINDIQETARRMGYRTRNDVISQVIFNDILEDIFGTQATTGLQGQVKRAITGAGKTLLRGGHPVDIASTAVDVVKGITKTDKRAKAIQALEKILKESVEEVEKAKTTPKIRIETRNLLRFKK